MQQLFPTLRECSVADVYSEPPPEGAHVFMNVVTTVDGRAAVRGTSHNIGTETDHALMMRIRGLADAVVHGAGTLEHEGIGPGVPREIAEERVRRGQRPQPLTVLMGGRRGVRLRGRLKELGPEELVVFVPADASSEELSGHATVYTTHSEHPDPREVVRELERRHGARRILVEGGPTIYNAFLRAGLVQELFWTLAPKVVGGDAPGMFSGPPLPDAPVVLQLRSMYASDSELYLRYCVAEGDGT